MKYKDITQNEIEALKHEYNMSDAHTHQSQSPTQRKIVEKLPALWYESENTKQFDMEQKFLSNFFRVQKQFSVIEGDNKPLLVYASSIAMVITANYLMKKNITVSLVHPCFDNITDILKHMKVPIEPLEEEWLHDNDKIYENLVNNVKADALFLVDPNNPTGFTLTGSANDMEHTKQGFREVFRFAKDHKKLLIFDFCFASFLLADPKLGIFDIYKEMNDMGVSYIAIEDTGKTWPLQDTKVAMLLASKDLYDEIYDIHTAYLLNVSPFILNVVNEYVLDSEKDEFASVYNLLDINRSHAIDILKGSLLEPLDSMTKVSVLWCRIRHKNIRATALKEYLTKFDVHVLPGTYFYWHDRQQGEQFIRIALARNTDIFVKSMKVLRKALDTFEKSLVK